MNKRIRVAEIIQGYHPRIGGAERQLACLAPLLQAEGIEVVVLTRRYRGLMSFEVINTIPVRRLPAPGLKPIASFMFTLSALPVLWRMQPDVIHAHELLSPATTALAAKRLFGTPVVAKVLRGGELGDLAKLKSRAFGEWRIAALRREIDSFVVISREIDRELAEVGVPAENRALIPNGVDTEHFKPASSEEKTMLRKSLGLPDGPIAIFAGRLDVEKRVNYLIDLWPQVHAAHLEANLVILGTGTEEAALRKSAGANVRFAGNVEDPAPHFRAADIFVLPSTTEGLSNALLEALACGLPAIATAVGGTPDVIEHGESGWLVGPDDPPALLEALLALLGDVSLRTRLGSRGRERVVKNYSLEAAAGKLRELYDRLSSPRLARTSRRE